MNHGRSGSQPYPAWASLRDRCRALGLLTWRSETAGTLVEEPNEPGLLTMFVRSSPVRSLVSEYASHWASQAKPVARCASPGLWLIPVVLEQRGRRLGVTIAAAFGPEIVGSPLVEASCRAAGLDLATTRAVLRKAATFDEPNVLRKASLLEWMAKDLSSLSEHESAVGGFTTELSQSYETIDMLYTLGRSMQSLHQPVQFFGSLCDRLHETLPYSWLAACFVDDVRSLGPLSGAVRTCGAVPWQGAALGKVAASYLEHVTATPQTTVTSAATDSSDEARVLLQPVMLSGRVMGVLFCGDRQDADPQVSSYDMQLIEAAAGFAGAFLENAKLYRDQQATFLGSLRALTAAIDAKDRYTCGHSERVAFVGQLIARAVGLDEASAERVHLSGLLHDVGKIGVPEAVLLKPGRLTDEEFAQIKRHPEIGHNILSGIPAMEDILPGVLHHHERWDGRGYPAGLRGNDIPQMARILAIADTFDAMSSTRAYREALPRDRVRAEIERSAGSQLDPALVPVFLALDLSEYYAMVQRHAEQFGSQPARLAA